MEALSPSIVLAAYAEQLFDGRRVVVFGDSTASVAEELVERGARTVLVYDEEASRAAVAAGQNRSKQISIAPLDDADLAVRDGAFDVAFIEDLSSFAHPETLLRRVRKALSTRGTAIVASPNPEARVALLPRTSGARARSPLGYYELYDAVSAEFDEVRMLGQTPFVGYAVVDFAPDGEPDVSIDSGLVPGGSEEPEWFVALAGRERVECDPVGIVQLPASRVTSNAAGGAVAEELRLARSSEARLLDRVAELEVELAGARERAVDTAALEHRGQLEAELLQRDASLADLQAQLTATETRDARARDEITNLRKSVSDARTELENLRKSAKGDGDARAELESLRKSAKSADDARVELESLRKSARSADDARAELAKLTPAQGRLEAEVQSHKQRAGTLETEVQSHKQRAGTLEAELVARKQEIAGLAAQLAALAAKNDGLSLRAKALETEKATAGARLDQHGADLAAQRQKLAAAEAELAQFRADDETPKELAALEAALQERGEHIRSLSAQLREAERVGRELLRERGRGSGTGPGANGPERLATENARLTANLEALSWTIEELEGRLATAGSGAR
ncbi:MAG TPA: hypothetical protein VH062_30945 [Polyangiaceae bacterium]|nr:hypothetical protein [Polyangiaceae bacterium]